MWTIISGLLGKVFGIIDKAVPDKTEAARLKAELQTKALEGDFNEVAKLIDARAQVVAAEAGGHSWLQRNWRPITMMIFVFIIFNNYVLFPYAGAFGYTVPALPTPPDLWAVIKLGLGGYVFGRSVEKSIEALKKN